MAKAYCGSAQTVPGGVEEGQAPAPRNPGVNPLGAPLTVTVPVSVPGPHWLDELLPEPEEPDDPLEPQESAAANLAPSDPSPIPDATSGRTVTSSTKLAAAITPKRVHRFQRFMTTPEPPQAFAYWAETLPQG